MMDTLKLVDEDIQLSSQHHLIAAPPHRSTTSSQHHLIATPWVQMNTFGNFLLAASVNNVTIMRDMYAQRQPMQDYRGCDSRGWNALRHATSAFTSILRMNPQSEAIWNEFIPKMDDMTMETVLYLMDEVGVDPYQKATDDGISACDEYPRLQQLLLQRTRDANWGRRYPFVQMMRAARFLLSGSEKEDDRLVQGALDKSVKLPAISRGTVQQNRDYLVSEVFCNEHIFRKIVEFV